MSYKTLQLTLLAFILMATVFFNVSNCQGVFNNFQDIEKLRLTLSTDKDRYLVGEPILISLSLFNPTDYEITLTFPSSKVFDGYLLLYSENGEFIKEIFNAKNLFYLMVITDITIKPFSSTEILNLTYSSHSLEPGKYIIKAVSVEFYSQTTQTTIEVDLSDVPEFSQVSVGLVMILLTLLSIVLKRQKKRGLKFKL